MKENLMIGNSVEVGKGFGKVDSTSDPQSFINYLDNVTSVDILKAFKSKTYNLMEPKNGSYLLDIGCGTGDDVRNLSQLVGEAGSVIGFDNSEVMISEAKKRTQNLDLPLNFIVGDSHNLPFADNSFNSCRAERVLQHLENPLQALQEMARVTRPEGKIIILDIDWETLILSNSNRSVTRKILNWHCDSLQNSWIGRNLFSLLRDVGLLDISVVPEAVIITDYNIFENLFPVKKWAEQAQINGLISEEEGSKWLKELENDHKKGKFFGAIMVFIAVGKRI